MDRRARSQYESANASLAGFAFACAMCMCFAAALMGVPAVAAPAPAGALISNTATSSYVVGVDPQSASTNIVTVTVGSAGPLPILSKSFSTSSITIGGSATLTFQVANSIGNPAQSGIAFTDTLPSGLQLTAGATATVVGAGCAAAVALSAPAGVSVSGLSMTAGTVSCSVVVTGVTDRGLANPSCVAVPAAFTNGPLSMSGLVGVTNGVVNQCLEVQPALTVVATPVCFRDTPYVDYNATALGFSPSGGVKVTWQKSTGEVVAVLTGQPMSGRLLWPGAAVDAGGNPIAWPGWAYVEEEWIWVDDGLRPDMRIVFEVNPTAQVTVTYPPASPACNANPPLTVNAPDMTVLKFAPIQSGPSPNGPLTVGLRYGNSGAPNSVKTNVTIHDALPEGMRLVPGSLRIESIGKSPTESVRLGNTAGTFAFDGVQGNYSASDTEIKVSFDTLGNNATGNIYFEVTIDSGIAAGTEIKNTATWVYTRPSGLTIKPRRTNTITYLVAGQQSISLVGMTIPSAPPGTTVTFDNILTNNTGRSDTFDISLGGSTYPAGTVLRLFRADGVTPLSDANGNGKPDTGVVAAGASYKIVVKAELPNGTSGGPFTVQKSAVSVSNPLVTATANDTVTVIASLCRVILEPSNTGRVAPGGSIVYAHVLTNVGNCTETISFPSNLTGNSQSGWTSQVFIDNPVAGGQSAPGALDPQDTTPSVPVTLAPGARLVMLVRVSAPNSAATGSSNTTDLRINGGSSGLLNVTDRTTVVSSGGSQIGDEITGFIDPGFNRPSVWAFIGRPLYLRAMAPSCNADPTVIERRTIIITGPNGEREEIIAVETAPDSGVFVAEGMMVRRPPVVPGDMILEGVPFETFQIDLVGCGRRISTTVTLIDPSGVVFDSSTNQPVAGATVRIVTAAGGMCTATPAVVSDLVGGQVVPAPSTYTTAADGRYTFPLVAPGDYCLIVNTPNGYTWVSRVPASQLPGGRNILATGPTSGGSYGGAFRVGPETGPVLVDIPVDGGLIGGLFVQKVSSRPVVEMGDMLDYSITVSNKTGYALDQSEVLLTDSLPSGFTYVAGSARREGKPIVDPAGGAGPRLSFNLGYLKRDQQVLITYRVRIGPGAMQGDGINRVVASYRLGGGNTLYSESNVATAKVQVAGGVFTDRAYILGKIFADCDQDGAQGRQDGLKVQEVGVPGVRIILEDGTAAITDAEGKYSFYGLLPRTHVLKIDRTTLPNGVTPQDFDSRGNRFLGKGDSRIVDLKAGELHRANFAIAGCSAALNAELSQRRARANGANGELDGRLQQRFEADPTQRLGTDLKALPASGVVGNSAPVANVPSSGSLAAALELAPASRVAPVTSASFGTLAQPVSAPVTKAEVGKSPKVPEIALEVLLPELDNGLGFMGLKDGDVLPYTQTAVRIKGMSGSTLRLAINGKQVPDDRIAKKAVFAERQSQAWEYLGIDLLAGENTLTVSQVDAFGNPRGEQSIKVRAPGSLGVIELTLVPGPKGEAIADGKTAVRVAARVSDRFGTPISARMALTLESSAGRFNVEDLNPTEPGLQTFIENGHAEFELIPPPDPVQALVRVASGEIRGEAKVDFLPDLRDLVAAGVIEGILNLRKLDVRGIDTVRVQDAFEQEITHLSRSWNAGKHDAGVRAAMFIKGKVKGEYLLTLAFDSDKNTRERLFRDIQPDEFYPVYGDSSVRTFDAQSTGRFYVRVDHRKSYLLYGDFNTSQSSEARKLSNYSRSLTGAKSHFENARVSASVFASRDTTRQIVDEFPANGTSGPFALTRARGLINSEKIEILTRDRSQPALVVRSQPLARFADYEIEPLTGRILLKAPVPSLDEALNPNFLRITYEIDQGGDAFWVGGAEVQFKATDRVELGAVAIEDRNPMDKFRLLGVNAIAKLADRTFLVAEIARTQREKTANGIDLGEKEGTAKRVELRHASTDLEATFYAGRADKEFDNPSAALSAGREEAGGRLSYRLDEKTRLKGELLHTEDTASGSKRDGALLVIERALGDRLRVEAGVRHARDTQTVQSVNGAQVPKELTAIRVRVGGDLPGVQDATAYLEAEVDASDSQRKIAAVGGDYKLGNAGRLYARHEFISSLTGPYGLNNQQRQNATVLGLNTEYMKDGSLFSEYRVRDAISGGDAEAALGLRNLWTLSEGLRLQTGFERVHAMSGSGNGESSALTFGLDYTANPIWKGSARLELRDGKSSDSILATVAAAAKLSKDWTLLARNSYSLVKNKGSLTGEVEQERAQAGVAYRDTDSDVWNGLARVEHRNEKDDSQPALKLKRSVDIVSIHANWQPRRPFTFTGRYAAKWVKENSNGTGTRSRGQLIGTRAIWDIAPRWDASVQISTLLGGAHSKSYSAGVELGYMVMENLWLSAGYNFVGYRDDDLSSGEHTSKGMYLRLRYKFDEDLFGGLRGNINPAKGAGEFSGRDSPLANQSRDTMQEVADPSDRP
ncbi:MAG: DUF11 domain-containing protein [Betaproteobacteria bacterium]|nr:DUF11 domain-containing protein [Betaproteobacteria bacterium]